MDCHLIQQQFANSQTDPGLLSDAEWEEIAAHLEVCDRCDAEFRFRDDWDEEIGRAMSRVAVPVDLHQRVLQTLADAERSATVERSFVPTSIEDDPESEQGFVSEFEAVAMESDRGAEREAIGVTSSPTAQWVRSSSVDATSSQDAESGGAWRVRRRWVIGALGSVAAMLLILAAWQLRPATPSTWTLRELRDQTPLNAAELAALDLFDESFEASLPSGNWRYGPVKIAIPPKGGALSGDARHHMAWYSFELRASRRRPVQGVLLVVPKQTVADSPQQTHFHTGEVEYIASVDGQFATVSWTEGELVYVCFVHGGADALETLQQALEIAPV